MLKIALHAFSSIDHLELEARLVRVVVECHGWILEEKPLSLGTYGLRFEVGLADIAEVYGALQLVGLQLTSVAHRALTEMCLCQKHLSDGEEAQVVSIDLRVATLGGGSERFRRFVETGPA